MKSGGLRMTELQEFKCPNCGGKMEFNAAEQKLKCPYCDTVCEIADFEEKPDHYESSAETYSDESLHVYSCNNCGGQIIMDENTVASACPYCGNPVVMVSNVVGENQPSRIIPFKLDKEKAKAEFKKHLDNKKFLPDAFKETSHLDEIKGLYVPFWIFDGEGEASLNFSAQTVRSWRSGDYEYTETSYYHLHREGDISFSAVPVDGSSKIEDELMQSIEPFDVKDAVPFNKAYLSGYMADKYDVGPEESVKVANNRIKNSTVSYISSTTSGYSNVSYTGGNVHVSKGVQEYVFYPVWLMKTKWNGKDYTFAMNGQTGKFVGDLPSDPGKITKTSIMTFLISAIAIFAVELAVIFL